MKVDLLPSLTISMCLAVTCASSLGGPLSEYMKSDPSPEAIEYRQVDGQRLKLYLFRPAPDNEGARPGVALFIHGGGWKAGGADVFFPHARYFASRGMLACSITYRLLTPDGKTKLPDAIDDCAAAVRYVREHAEQWQVDPNRIVAFGDSAGGHLAACLGSTIVERASRADACVLYNPIVDLTDPAWTRFAVGGTFLAKNAPPVPSTPENLASASAVSPIAHVEHGLGPALVMHGLDDTVVSTDHARRFAKQMIDADNLAELVLLEHARHAFVVTKYKSTEQQVVDALVRTDTFLSEYGFLHGPPTLTVSTPPVWTPPSTQPARK